MLVVNQQSNLPFYRIETSDANDGIDVQIDELQLLNQLDPLGKLVNTLKETDIIKNCTIHISYILKEIVEFVGYIESTLKYKSTRRFWSSRYDTEQCYFISLSPTSNYSYLLKSFSCDITCHKVETVYYATLVIWDKLKIKMNKEEILWQQKYEYNDVKTWKCIQCTYEANPCTSTGCMACLTPKGRSRNIVKFYINIKLQKNKRYLFRIDVPFGEISCHDLIEDVDKTKKFIVNSMGRFADNQYYFRSQYKEKLYELVLI